MPGAPAITIGERVHQLAHAHPDRPALIAVDATGAEISLRWRDLESASTRCAGALRDAGAGGSSRVGIVLPNDPDHVVAALGAWKLGALVVPLDAHSTVRELQRLRDTAGLQIIVGTAGRADLTPQAWTSDEIVADPEPPRVAPRSAHATGGSTGQPRIIVRQRAWTYGRDELPSDADRTIGLGLGQVQLVMLPLHQAGFTRLHHALALDHTIVLMQRFVPELFPRLVRRHRVNVVQMAPAMMHRILGVADLRRDDLSSIAAIHHGFARCPQTVKRGWLNLVGAEKIYEGYGSNERIGDFWIRGDEWLDHPGSVGKAGVISDVRIFDERGNVVPPGSVGEIFLRSASTVQPEYLGPGEPLPERDGFLSVGDMGYVDADGYLFVLDRRSDMINVAGTKVYPAEVEEVLLDVPGVLDAAVVGREHEMLGHTVHALVVPADADRPPTVAQLYDRCRRDLSIAKVPTSYEFVSDLGRTDAGKIRRLSLKAT